MSLKEVVVTGVVSYVVGGIIGAMLFWALIFWAVQSIGSCIYNVGVGTVEIVLNSPEIIASIPEKAEFIAKETKVLIDTDWNEVRNPKRITRRSPEEYINNPNYKKPIKDLLGSKWASEWIGKECQIDVDCNDGNECSVDRCKGGGCSYKKSTWSECDSGQTEIDAKADLVAEEIPANNNVSDFVMNNEAPQEPTVDQKYVQKYSQAFNPALLENLIKNEVQEKNLDGLQYHLNEFYNSIAETSAGIGRKADKGDFEAAKAEADEIIMLLKSVRSLIGGLTIRELNQYPVLKKHIILLDRATMGLQELRDALSGN